MKYLLLLLLLSACGGDPITVTPSEIRWGEVDFQQDLPVEGYAAQQLIVQNNGRSTLQFRILQFDEDHLRLGALFEDGASYTLIETPGAAAAILTVGVHDYELTERDTEVSGSFSITADGVRDPVPVSWSFTPVRNFAGDTGRD